MSAVSLTNWDRWRVLPKATTFHDSITSYQGCDESWHVYWPHVGWANVYRFGDKFAMVTNYAWMSWSKCWYSSFDAAALAAVLYIEAQRAYNRTFWARNQARARRKKAAPSSPTVKQ